MDRTIKPETPKSELASTFNPAAGGGARNDVLIVYPHQEVI